MTDMQEMPRESAVIDSTEHDTTVAPAELTKARTPWKRNLTMVAGILVLLVVGALGVAAHQSATAAAYRAGVRATKANRAASLAKTAKTARSVGAVASFSDQNCNDINGKVSDNSKVCCTAECPICGGAGCGAAAIAAGLSPDECCIGHIMADGIACEEEFWPPCIMPDDKTHDQCLSEGADYCSYFSGDDQCDEECNIAACDYDGGDCLMCANGCSAGWQDDGSCDEECNNADCNFDGGDCEEDDDWDDYDYWDDYYQDQDCSHGCYAGWEGDGICDIDCLNPSCGYDGGDCCQDGAADDYCNSLGLADCCGR